MWIIEHHDGSVEQVESRKGHGNRKRSARMPREIDFAVEWWNWARHRIEARPVAHAAQIDRGHEIDRGVWRRAVDYAAKEIEARLLLIGIDVGGRLAKEAELRGVDPIELARAIAAAADHADVELKRVAAKINITKE